MGLGGGGDDWCSRPFIQVADLLHVHCEKVGHDVRHSLSEVTVSVQLLQQTEVSDSTHCSRRFAIGTDSCCCSRGGRGKRLEGEGGRRLQEFLHFIIILSRHFWSYSFQFHESVFHNKRH